MLKCEKNIIEDKSVITIEKLNIKDIDAYLMFAEDVKDTMEHKEWLGDFKKEDYEYLLSNGSVIYIWKINEEIIASGMLNTLNTKRSYKV